MTKNEIFGNNLAGLMKAKNVDCVDLSWLSDVPLSCIYAVLEGKRKKLPMRSVEAMLSVLNTSFKDLMIPEKYYTAKHVEEKKEEKKIDTTRCQTCGYWRKLGGAGVRACHYAARPLSQGRFTRTKHGGTAPDPKDCPYYDPNAKDDEFREAFRSGAFEAE